MRIGIPKERILEEKRVALAPAGVDALVKSGHSVFIENGAGAESHFTDEQYQKVGATIVYSPEETFQRSDMIVKIAPLTEEESEMLQEEQVVFSFLHLALSRKKIIDNILKKRVTAIGYELIESDGNLPVMHTMSEIAGQVAIQVAERYLESSNPHSRGVLMGGITGVAPAAIVIIGAGVVGLTAARAALGRGAHVIILDKDIARLRRMDSFFKGRVTTVVSNPYTLARGAKFADVLIGAASIRGEKAPMLVTEEMVKTMKNGAVIVDVAIDQGGCVETSYPTTMSNPVFERHGVIHFCVPNMPAFVSRTASYGITNASLQYILNIADNGLNRTLMGDQGLAKGVCVYNGYCCNETLAETFGCEYRRLHIFSHN